MYGSWVLVIIILISLIPVALVYLWFRLAKYKFSIVWFFLALIFGAAAVFPALIFQDLLNIPFDAATSSASLLKWELFYHIFIRIAFTEELGRLLMLLLFFWVSRFFKLDKDFLHEPGMLSNEQTNLLSYLAVKKGTAAGLIAGLGFAILEGAVLAVSNTGVLLIRAVTAAPLHAACGARIGAAAKMLRSSPIQSILRIFTATAIHGIYNFMISLPGIPAVAAILVAFTALGSIIVSLRGGWSNSSD